MFAFIGTLNLRDRFIEIQQYPAKRVHAATSFGVASAQIGDAR